MWDVELDGIDESGALRGYAVQQDWFFKFRNFDELEVFVHQMPTSNDNNSNTLINQKKAEAESAINTFLSSLNIITD